MIKTANFDLDRTLLGTFGASIRWFSEFRRSHSIGRLKRPASSITDPRIRSGRRIGAPNVSLKRYLYNNSPCIRSDCAHRFQHGRQPLFRATFRWFEKIVSPMCFAHCFRHTVLAYARTAEMWCGIKVVDRALVQ